MGHLKVCSTSFLQAKIEYFCGSNFVLKHLLEKREEEEKEMDDNEVEEKRIKILD